ncbi:MAG: ACT domain-containing protein [Planctomycetota bacterium]|nr:ACT domain-containing protein [Planctomycetota bacterium]
MAVVVFKQLSVFLENKPGVLQRLCESFSKEKINIQAFSVSDTVDHAVVRMVVANPVKAIHLLEQHGVLVVETDVLGLRLSDKPGVLAKVAERLAKSKVNIEYAYGTAGGGGKSLVVMRVNDTEKARKVLAR